MEMVVEIDAVHDGVEHYYRCDTPGPTHWEGLGPEKLRECLNAAEGVIVNGVNEAKQDGVNFVCFGYEASPHDIAKISVKVVDD